jgi:hypothetical protein
MSCFGCERNETAAERLGWSWCRACLDTLEFEERLAAANGMFIAEVFLRHGQVGYVFAHQPGRDVSRADFYRIGLTRSDVVREVVDAARAFRRSLLLVGDRVAAVNRDAPRRAREFIDVATKHEALLAEDERRDIANVLAIARSIAQSVH